jgi:hypothetical protein
MALDERTRHALHLRLDELVGPELAGAMMSAYEQPLATAADIAVLRGDIAALEERMSLRFEGMLHREIHQAITSQTRTVLFGLIGTVMATGGTIVGAAALLR